MKAVVSESDAKQMLRELGFQEKYWKEWRLKWAQLRNNAPLRGCVCELTLKQYLRLATKAGIKKPDEIGKTPEKFQMARKGDAGNYEWGNCRFITMSENLKEREENGGNARMIAAKTGRTAQTHRHVAEATKKIRGRNALTHESVKRSATKRSNKFCLRSPSGSVHTGTNLRKFCRDHELGQAPMSLVCRGEKPQYKGWTGSYV